MGTFVTALIVFGGAALVVRSMLRRHKQNKLSGNAGCGCGCSSCSASCDFAKPEQK